jgi:type IV pilus assembly protein PilM
MNPFKSLTKIFSSNDNDSFVGIDIGPSSIKVVQLKSKKGVIVLETYGELSLGPYANIEVGRSTNLSNEQVSEALVSLIKESNVTAKRCGVSIPIRSSLVFTMEMPSVDEKQLAKMIPIEARKYIPVSINEVDLDWKIIPKEENVFEDENKQESQGKKVEVFVVAIHKEIISKNTEIVSNSGLNLEFLELEIFSTIRAVAGQNILNFAVLDMGSSSSKLYLVERGIVKDSHIVGKGSQDISLNISRSLGISVDEAERKKKEIGLTGSSAEDKQISDIISSNLLYTLDQTNKSILDYQKEHNKNIDRVVITGGGAISKGFLDFAKSKINTEVEIADPFSKVQNPAFLDELLKQVGPGFSVALGLALRGLKSKE